MSAGTRLYIGVDIGSTTVKVVGVDAEGRISGEPVYLRLDGFATQVDALKQAMQSYLQSTTATVAGLGITGSGRELHRQLIGADVTRTEIFAHAVGLTYLVQRGYATDDDGNPVSTVGACIEIGGQDSKVITFDAAGRPAYFNMNTICSAGTGEFLKQLADEAGTTLEEFGRIANESTHPAQIDATCTVFSKRDFRHLTQKGVPLADRLMGACHALVRNYINNVVCGAQLPSPLFFQGGVAYNSAVRRAFEGRLGTRVYVTPLNGVVGALGMAVITRELKGQDPDITSRFDLNFFDRRFTSRIRYCHGCANSCDLAQVYEERGGQTVVLDTLGGRCDGSRNPRNVKDKPRALDRVQVPVLMTRRTSRAFDVINPGGKQVRKAVGRLFAGIDGGSRGTKYVLVRTHAAGPVGPGEIEILTAGSVDTAGDAMAAALQALRHVQAAVPAGEELAAIGTTGSAGELIRDMICRQAEATADARVTEIVAHYAWASTWLPEVGTVMDIGGNDAKLIAVRDGGLDFAMNDKCAAGTGVFLEAVARRFNVPIAEYADIALASRNPARVAGRCAVFGESDIVHKSRLGFSTADLLLGLAFAVCRTYLSDVGRGKPIRVPVVAQGGTFLNRAVQYAFRETLGLSDDDFVVASDHRYVLCAGALGAALFARSRWEQGYDSSFKGFATVFGNTYHTVTLTCQQPDCRRRCSGVVALLENGVPIAGYKAVDCAHHRFSGLFDADGRAAALRLLEQSGAADAISVETSPARVGEGA